MAEKILIISPVPVLPGHAGNRMRIKSICSVLMEQGYVLDFFYTGFEKSLSGDHTDFFNGSVLNYKIDDSPVELLRDPLLRFKEILNGIKIKASYLQRKFTSGSNSAIFNKSLYEFKNLKKIQLLNDQISGKNYKAVILNYSVYSHLFDLFDEQTIKIIDTHDRLSDRYQLFLNEGLEPVEWKSISPADERKSLEKADVIWAITESEANYFRTLIKKNQTKIATVPHLSPFKVVPVSNYKSRKKLLTVGGKSVINVNGLNWFLTEVWPQVWSSFPEAELFVGGSICDAADQFATTEGVTLLGRFDNPEEVYHTADLCVNPIQFGTGLKIKTIEALSSGKKIITTIEGAAGLDRFIGKGLICSDDSDVWIEKISTHFTNSDSSEIEAAVLENEVHKYNEDALSNILKSIKGFKDASLS